MGRVMIWSFFKKVCSTSVISLVFVKQVTARRALILRLGEALVNEKKTKAACTNNGKVLMELIFCKKRFFRKKIREKKKSFSQDKFLISRGDFYGSD